VGRKEAFNLIDLPIAATSLAQASGRLIRTATDQGVVAVLDRRLATMNYRRYLIDALPPMARTRHRAEVEQFLRDITA
jgi:ATP-dependent DNA helicase DinG